MLYELISISCGVETVHHATADAAEVMRVYKRVGARDCLRIRADGRMLTIREASRLCGGDWQVCVDGFGRPAKKAKCNTHGTRRGPDGHIAPNRRAVELVDSSGNVLQRYVSVQEAAEANHLSTSAVCGRCAGRCRQTGDEVYRYAQK